MVLEPVLRPVLSPVARAIQAGVEGGLSPNTSLDFSNGTYIVGGQSQSFNAITFSRGTNATLTDSNGRIAWAPHNLLTNSEDFEAAAWVKVGSTVTANATMAPDGTTTVDKLVEDTSTGVHVTTQNVAMTAGVSYTFSAFVKAAERTRLWFERSNSTLTAFTANVDFSTGTVVSSTGSVSVSVTLAGSGFYRVTLTVLAASTASGGVQVDLVSTGSTTNYTGDGTSGLFIWGAQLNVANAPVNLLTWSEQFDNAAWTKRGTCTVTPNAIAAPDGTVTADLISGLNTSGNDLYSTVATVPLNSPASPSFYINKVSATGTLRVGNPSDSAKGAWNVNLALVDSGWQRITLTHPAVTVVTSFVGNGSGDGLIFLAQAGGPLSFYLWGAQLNTGSVALPYVATTSSIYLPPAYNSTTPKNLLGFTQEPENAAWTKNNSFVQTNLLLQSNDFLTSWTPTNITRTLNSITSPSGSVDGVKIEATAGAVTTLFQTATVLATSATASVYVKQGTGATVANSFNLRNATTSTTLVSGTLNYSTGVFTYSVGSTGVVVTDAGNGWWRVAISATSGITSGDSIRFFVGFLGSTETAGTHLYAYGAQLVQGSTAGDYTQTTSAAAVTRYLNWDGTLTGRKLVENTATGSHLIQQTITTPSTPQVVFAYVKAAERNLRINLSDNTTGNAACLFDLATGFAATPTSSGSWTSVSASMTNVGGGWYRIALLATRGAGTQTVVNYELANGTSVSYTGDGTSGIYVSDFQLSNSASVDPYVYNPQAAAASAAYYGPRFDYNPTTLAANGLLIEEPRTNLLTYSEDFANANWAKPGTTTIVANTDIAPDGTTTADRLVVGTGLAAYRVQQNFAYTTGVTYTHTCYVKKSSYRYAFMYGGGAAIAGDIAILDLDTGLFTLNQNNRGSVTPLTNGWYRLVYTAIASASATEALRIGFTSSSSTVDVTGDGVSGGLLWGAQLEAGSFATSYIPTVASQVTRNADSASMLGDNFYTWYNPNEGTLGAEALAYNANAVLSNSWVPTVAAVLSNTSNYFSVGRDTGGSQNRPFGNVVNGGVTQAALSNSTVWRGDTVKQALAVKANDFAYNDSTSVTTLTDTSGSIPSVTSMSIGSRSNDGWWNGHIRRISYYKTRLPNSTLTALTT